MAFNNLLAEKVRTFLAEKSDVFVQEKKMFGGLAFMVNGKMCINISGENLMCRFDPKLQPQLLEKKGFSPMVMKGKELRSYGYIAPVGLATEADFEFWMKLCLDFNQHV